MARLLVIVGGICFVAMAIAALARWSGAEAQQDLTPPVINVAKKCIQTELVGFDKDRKPIYKYSVVVVADITDSQKDDTGVIEWSIEVQFEGSPNWVQLFGEGPITPPQKTVNVNKTKDVTALGTAQKIRLTARDKAGRETTEDPVLVACTVGGIVGGAAQDLPQAAGAPLETAGSSGGNGGALIGLVAGVTAGVVALGGAGAWYARRRWLR